MKARKLTVAMLSAGIAATLAACGSASASHVVDETTVPTSSSTTTAPAAGTTATTAVSGATTPTTTTPDTLSANTLSQVAAELGSLDSSLSTADSDLNDPQGDS